MDLERVTNRSQANSKQNTFALMLRRLSQVRIFFICAAIRAYPTITLINTNQVDVSCQEGLLFKPKHFLLLKMRLFHD